MDSFKNVKFDVDRIIIQLLIPGIFAIFPFFLLLIKSIPDAQGYLLKSETMTAFVLFIISIAAGLILEDTGSHIENVLYELNKSRISIPDEWHKYLKLTLPSNSDLIAQRYLKTIIIRMKFELSFALALIIMSIGLIFLNNRLDCCVYIIPVVLSGYLLYESNRSTILLIDIRKDILEKCEEKSTLIA